MKLYQTTTQFNCGIDLHSKNMYICIMDKDGNILLHKNIKRNDFKYFLKIAKAYLHDLTIACESTFNWYWLADACEAANIKFVLGHALYMKVIYGCKTKNDKVDSKKIADLLRANHLPMAHCCSAEKRPIRELLRRRSTYVNYRASIKAHLSSSVYAPGLDPLTPEEKKQKNREKIPEKFINNDLQLSARTDVDTISFLDDMIKRMEHALLRQTRKHFRREFEIINTIPGFGDILSLIVLYEVDDIKRFENVRNFASYSRVIRCDAESAGKKYGAHGTKIGNKYLKWAFGEASVYCRKNEKMKAHFTRLEKKHGKRKAHNILAHQLARAAYSMLKNGTVFDIKKFLKENS